MGFDFAVGSGAELSRVCTGELRPGNLEHPEWNSTKLSVMDMSVWSQLLTFDETALTKKGAYYDLEAYLFEDVHQRFHS